MNDKRAALESMKNANKLLIAGFGILLAAALNATRAIQKLNDSMLKAELGSGRFDGETAMVRLEGEYGNDELMLKWDGNSGRWLSEKMWMAARSD